MKTNMKRCLAALLVLTLLMALAACGGGGSALAGKWKMTEVELNGVKMSLADAVKLSGQEVSVDMSLEADGKFTFTMKIGSTERSATGTYKEEGNTLTLTAENEKEPMELKKDGSQLVIDQSGTKMYLDKQ